MDWLFAHLCRTQPKMLRKGTEILKSPLCFEALLSSSH